MTAILSIVGFNLLVYFRTIFYDMVIDDNCRRFHIKDIPKNRWLKLYRITKYSGTGGISLWADHLITLTLHIGVCCLIYVCFGRNDISFITALIFSIHPVTNQVSIWLNGKRYAIMAICVLVSYALPKIALLCYTVALFWGYCGLPAILLYQLPIWAWIALVAPMVVISKPLINKIGSRLEHIPHGEIKRFRLRKLVIAVKILGYVFLHCLVPRRTSFYHMFMERFGFSKKDNDYWYSFNKDFWVGLLLSTGIVWLTIVNWDNYLGLGLFWWLIFTLPWLHFPFGMTQAISERVYYLPLIGLVLAVVFSAYTWLLYPYYMYILIGYGVFCLTKLWFYMPAYRNVDTFYEYALHEFPEHFRARAHVIQKNLQDQKIFYCLRDCGVGVKYHPNDCNLNILMAQSLMALGFWDKAKEFLKLARENIIPGQEV